MSALRDLRKCLALLSIIIGTTAVAIPDAIWSKVLIAFATGLNAASLYLVKDEPDEAAKAAAPTA
jgi:hypothetical protein